MGLLSAKGPLIEHSAPKPYRKTPSKPSIYPGACCNRLCTVARLFIQATSKPLSLLNTHLDNVSDAQRRYGASLLLIRGRFEAAISKGPVMLTGDFNSSPTGSDSGAYEIVTGKVPPVPVDKTFADQYSPREGAFPDFKFLDTRTETPRFGVSGNFGTFTGWSPIVTKEWERIDFIFGGNNRGWCVVCFFYFRKEHCERSPLLISRFPPRCRTSTACRVGAGMSDDGMMNSDHRPVFNDLTN